MLLDLTSAVFLGSESLGTRDHILLSQLFVATYDSQGHGGGIRPRLHTGYSCKVKVKVKVTLRLTVSQSVSLGVEPHLGLMTRYLVMFDSCGLFFCGAPSLTRGRVCQYSCKRPSLSLINLRHGPRTENILRAPYPSNSSSVIKTAILLLLPALPLQCI
jgi:hypothetical protein